MRRAKAFIVVIVLTALCALPSVAQQRIPYCNIVAVESRRVGNAVQVTIRADGLMRLRFNPEQFVNTAQAQQQNGGDPRKPVLEIPFRVTNARSQVSSFVDVGIYPVSHVEVSLPSDTPDGLGVDIRVVLFNPGVIRSGRVGVEEVDFGSLPYAGPTFSVQQTQDQRSLIILVTSDRRTLPPVQRRKPGEATATEMQVEADGNTVSLFALNADLRELLREVARQTGQVVLVDPDLERVVSLCLQEVSVEEALRAIAAGYGLELGHVDGAWAIGEGAVTSMSTYLESSLEKIRLHYISAASARNSLPEFLLKYLRVNAGENSLTVAGPPPLVQKVREDIQRIDRPVPHVQIDVLIVEISDTTDSESVLRYAVTDAHNATKVNVGTGDITYQVTGASRTDIEARLRLLAAQGKVRIRAKPTAVALNGQNARIFSGYQRYIKADYFEEWSQAFITRVFPVDLGVSLEMNCWVGSEGVILATVTPQVTAVADLDVTTGLPTVSTRRAETTLLLRDGETLFIGGLKLQQQDTLTRKVPILGDLPLIGGLFRVRTQRRTTTELALFVTPRIITSSHREVSRIQ
ncbi:MAG: type II secretion system protein GspD [Armatimonadota bacterium]